MSLFELLARLGVRVVGAIMDSAQAGGLTPEEQKALLARISSELEAAAARVASTEVRNNI